jgi:hypothetical protein
MQHHFDSEIAEQFGVNVAIFLDQMAFWITKNLANERHIHDGSCWTRNTLQAYTKMFPYLSVKQIRKILSDCEKHDLIKIGNYNKTQYDRTGWYALTEKSAKLLNISIFPKGQMDCDKRANGSVQKGTTIPVTNTVTNTSRERKKRAPLSENFIPDEKMILLLEEVSLKTNISSDKLLIKFKNVQKSKEKISADWNAELENFLINEKPNISLPVKRLEPFRSELKSTVKWFNDNH